MFCFEYNISARSELFNRSGLYEMLTRYFQELFINFREKFI